MSMRIHRSGWRITRRRQALGLTRYQLSLKTGVMVRDLREMERDGESDEETWNTIESYLTREEDAALRRAGDIMRRH